jgi:serine/threonine protein kinase
MVKLMGISGFLLSLSVTFAAASSLLVQLTPAPALVRPKKRLPSLKPILPKIMTMQPIGRYDSGYMKEYTKMLDSLLPLAELRNLYDLKTLQVHPNEPLTLKVNFKPQALKLPKCSADKTRDWEQVKILQMEQKNRVTLKENLRSGNRVVEKSMEVKKHYDKEMDFFTHASHRSPTFFPALICSAVYDVKREKEPYRIVTDFVNGEKSHVMAKVATARQLRFMVAQFFNSVVELHKTGFIHCDLSPANVMVSNSFEVKLIDFGMALRVGQAYGGRGSFYTRAPELHGLSPGRVDVAIDWWAFGATVAIWYHYHLDIPASNPEMNHLYNFTPMKFSKKKKNFIAGRFPPEFPADLRKFLALFLVIDPELRTFSTERLQNLVRSHEFFNGFDWSTAAK